MIILGFGLLFLGIIIGLPMVWTVGIVLLVVGYVLVMRGRRGHTFVGRSHWL